MRREFDDYGSTTRRAAREMIDLHAWGEGREIDPQDKRNMALHKFASEVNANTHETTLPSGGSLTEPGSDQWNQSAEAVVESIVSRGGEDAL